VKAGWIRGLGFGLLAVLCALPLAAAPKSGKISGVVMDALGTPQMGATVQISPEQAAGDSLIELLTNDRGKFSSAGLASGQYSVKVTLAGFLPAVEQHIQVEDQHTTVLQIVLGSLLTSFEKLRRQPDQQVSSDEWVWVLRSAAATRAVLRWQDDDGDPSGGPAALESAGKPENRGRLDVTSGANHPGSVSNMADSPATAIAYDMGIGDHGQLLFASQFSYEGGSPAGGFAAMWLPSGEPGVGSATSVVMREAQLGAYGPTFRGIRVAHDNQLALGDRVNLRYGSEFLTAGLGAMTMAARPRAEMAIQLAQEWQAAVTAAASPWREGDLSPGALQSAINALDAFPTLMLHDGRPVFQNNLHEEIAIEHELSKNASVSAAVFHDRSTHTAVFGRGVVSGGDFLQDYFSDVFVYDAGLSGSMGARAAYKQKISNNLETTLVYAYAGVLAPSDDPSVAALRNQLTTQYRHSVGARATATVPCLGTRISAGYKWVNGPAVTHQDPFGESIYHLDPFMSMEVRQRLPSFFPGHMEALVDLGNLFAQGYVSIPTSDGRVILVPSYRYFRGGLSFQF